MPRTEEAASARSALAADEGVGAMTQDLHEDLVFITRDELERSRREVERAWGELLAEASAWPTIRLDDDGP